MKDYKERVQSINTKAKNITARRKIWISVTASLCAVVLICGVMFIPFGQEKPTNITAYKKSEYFPLIEKINAYNNHRLNGGVTGWDMITNSGLKDDIVYDTANPGTPELGANVTAPAPSTPSESGSTNKYEETTLNQVEGVTEGDLLKRSSTHAFYLTWHYKKGSGEYVLYTYTLAKAEMQCVSEYSFSGNFFGQPELYLSDDACLVTILANTYNDEGITYTCVISLDVSDPTKIAEVGRTHVVGNLQSSRKVNGELLLFTRFYLPQKVDFDNPQTFVPTYGQLDDLNYCPMKDIYLPLSLSDCSYNIIFKISETTLETTSKCAMLSVCSDIYVSAEHIFAVGYPVVTAEQPTKQNGYLQMQGTAQTPILVLTYQEEIQNVGKIMLDGSVRDRYSLHEKDGKLFAVTGSNDGYVYDNFGWSYTVVVDADGNPIENTFICKYTSETQTASLYCFDIASGNLVSKVVNFAPQQETVRACRFDGNTGYVCTAIRQTDPVFVFDLTDPTHITQKDTGTIPGYSINLLPFGDYLLGIGYGQTTLTMKLELYRQTESGVESVASYEREFCHFSTEYKAHFVDSQRQLVGLHIWDYNQTVSQEAYLLLHFDGENLNVVLQKPCSGQSEDTRAFYADGLYVFTDLPNAFYCDLSELLD